MDSFFLSWLNMTAAVVAAVFRLDLFAGVSLGDMLVAVGVMSVIITALRLRIHD